MSGPLDGIKVLDLSRFIAGPHCGMLLGDLGSEVVKVERPNGGEEGRLSPPTINGESIYVMVYNRNKRGITLNFRDSRAQALLRELARHADVLIENFRPGTMEQMGCSWEVLHEINPRLIMARISGFGQDGPYAQQPCFDVVGQAMSGLMEMTGQPGGPPTMAGSFIVDYCSALYATIGVLGALQHRERTGRGQVVDVALLDSAVSLLMTAIPEYLLLGQLATRTGNRDRYVAPANSYRASDGTWVVLVGGSVAHFPRLVHGLEMEELLQDPRFFTLEARLGHVEEIESVVAGWVGRRTADEVVAAMEEVGIPCTKVATIADVVANPQLKHRRQIVETEHPTAGRVPMQGITIQYSETKAEIRRPAPTLGQHNEEVLSQWLGYSSEKVAQLRAEGVI